MSDVFGSAGRLGYIAPSTCERLAKEFYGVVPDDLGLLIATLPITRIHSDHVALALEQVERAAVQLAETGADAIFSAGLPLVLDGGGEPFDAELRQRLEDATGLPCGTDLGASLEAIRGLGLDDLVLVTPFTDDVTDRIVAALRAAGVGVLASSGLGHERQREYGLLPSSAPTEVIDRLLAEHPDARGVYVPCGRFGDVHAISALEKQFGLPVVTANQVVLWWSLRWAGLHPVVDDCGQLLAGLTGAISGSLNAPALVTSEATP